MTKAEPWNSSIPDTLNGYPVIAYIEHPNGYVSVMMDRSVPLERTDLIVATWWPELGNRWQWGNYDLHSFQEADRVLRDVADRNGRR